jgi:hypothetical protein
MKAAEKTTWYPTTNGRKMYNFFGLKFEEKLAHLLQTILA